MAISQVLAAERTRWLAGRQGGIKVIRDLEEAPIPA